MVTYIASAIVGLGIGAVVGFIKNTALWRAILKTDREILTGALYLRLGIGYAINVITLLFVYLMRDATSFDFIVTIIGTAVGLSAMAKMAPISKIVEQVKEVREQEAKERI